MKLKSRSILILTILFGYIILQFIWWEILLVKQTGQIIELKQKIAELQLSNENLLINEIDFLHQKKKTQVLMVVGEGTVFLLLLLFGIHKIRQAQNKEQELNLQQKNFFLSITHELKTPIAATKLQLQTLQKHQLDQVQQKELITNALNETERLNNLIDNLLLANRLDSGEFKFQKQKENISELLLETINRYYKNNITNNELSIDIEKELYIEIDKTAFPSVITNLIDNAFKYSFEVKKVRVSCNKINDKIVLTVKDHGCGITDSDKKKVFDKFFRSGNEETRTTKGTGLGLFIVDYITKKHNGEITLKNNNPKGSIFEITFNAA